MTAWLRIPALWLFLLALLAAGAAPATDPDDLIRQGNAAFERGDFPAAEGYYARAEAVSTDPGLVAFNQAATLFRRGMYREAELHYRLCLTDATGDRRARVLYDLGNCLLQRDQGRNAELLTEAIGFYRQCLRQEGVAAELIRNVRHNLELAKLLRLQAPPAPSKEDDTKEPPKNPESGPDNNQEQPGSGDDTTTQSTARPDPDKGKPEPVKPMAGDTPMATDQQVGGKGTLPPVPDEDQLVPMSAEDTAVRLQQAAQRILRQRRADQQSLTTAAPRSAKPW